MRPDMLSGELKNEIMLVMGICAHDGLLSSQELNYIRSAYFGDQSNEVEFERLIDEFFDMTETLEQLFERVSNVERALSLAGLAAAADGLDIRENLALLKCRSLAAAN
jgi:copper homeostasis protein CutC